MGSKKFRALVLVYVVFFLLFSGSAVSASVLLGGLAVDSNVSSMSAAMTATCVSNLQALCSLCDNSAELCCKQVSFMATSDPHCFCDRVATSSDPQGKRTDSLKLFFLCEVPMPDTVSACLSTGTPPPPSTTSSLTPSTALPPPSNPSVTMFASSCPSNMAFISLTTTMLISCSIILFSSL
ncbi:hypothetical protein GOP47_0005484 [Adiantum capillus-veneris]|uniref:Uncharacterized protein n=1 Tax=Adiantum capillus-veneris TaxID=13818 RepID=A0A9D4ZP61_ADICA|nr:hypothetical protein GOP47_0005484 [Adiantum capillus-veneris]